MKKKKLNFFKKIRSSYKEQSSFIVNLCFYSICYGLVINYMMWGIFRLPFKFYTFPSYGVLAYLIKEELPGICARIFPRRRVER